MVRPSRLQSARHQCSRLPLDETVRHRAIEPIVVLHSAIAVAGRVMRNQVIDPSVNRPA